MIEAKLRAEIRRLFFAEHWKVGTIASELSVHHETVRRAINADAFVRRDSVRPSMLDPYKEFVVQVLDRHPRLRATRIFDMIVGRGFSGSANQLRRYVRMVRPERQAEAYLALRTLPGEQGQVDWGSFGRIQVGHASRSLSCFVLVLSWSRAMYAHFTLDQKLESFVHCHTLAFDELGGVPRTLLYDNLKSVVLDRQGDHVQYHPRLLELAGHYHFAPKPCAPYRANEKGKVERAIQYLRHSFFAARHFRDVDDLNAQVASWTDRVAHARPAPGDPDRRPVSQLLDEERDRLLPLPEHRFEASLVKPVRTGKQPYIRFDLNDYSVPDELTRKPLVLIVSSDEVRITKKDGTVVARHERSYDRAQRIEDPKHLDALAAKKRRARELRGRNRLTDACPQANEILETMCLRGEPLRPVTTRLNRLLDRYGADELAVAIAMVIERGSPHPSSVGHVLDQRARARGVLPAIDVVLPDDPRVRDLDVRPHQLSDYDALGTHHDEEDRDDDSR